MLVSPTNGLSSPSMTIHENNFHRQQPNHSSPLIPPTSLPKHFNVPFAIQHGYFRCIRYLLQLNYDPNERNSQLRTPLILCAYVENDRWSLSLAQNLLEKGAKVALDDHARRNAMHHACALQRLHLVQLYSSCLDFNIEAKDCEGNTCLHYVAITGNCEIAELLIRTADKMGIRLDQCVNREGCSAAILALKYGHIECANQITHRDWDEFFVVPRPLSIYETPSPTPTATDDNQTTIISKKRSKLYSSIKNDSRPPILSFGLLKIIFNESDTSYSTRLAGLCKQEKQKRLRPPSSSKSKTHEAIQTSTMIINKIERTKSTITNGMHSSSTEALVNETQLSNLTNDCPTIVDNHHRHNNTFLHSDDRTSPRIQLLIQQKMTNKPNSTVLQKTPSKTQLSIDDMHKTKINLIKNDNDEVKSKSSIPTIYRQSSTSTLNHFEYQTSPTMINPSQRAKTAVIRQESYVNPPPSRLSTENPQTITTMIPTSVKKKSVIINPIESSNRQASVHSISSMYSQTNRLPRSKSAAAAAAAHRTFPQSNDSPCSIREAKGRSSRFNKPEEVFGLRPEELFAPEQYQPKILDQRSSNKTKENTRSKRQQFQTKHHIWQQDVDKIIELYNIHHSTSYRKSAVPPPPPTIAMQPSPPPPLQSTEILTEISQNSRARGGLIAKTNLSNGKPAPASKQSGTTLLNLSQRNAGTRSSMKVHNT